MSLTEDQIKNAPARVRQYRLADFDGLYVMVTPSGGKLFRYDYEFGGMKQTLSLGRFPMVSLKLARQKRNKAYQTLEEGRNPAAEKREAKVAAKAVMAVPTFTQVAREWLAASAPGWSAQYTRVVRSRVEADLISQFGQKRMNEIRREDIRAALALVEERGVREGAHRLKNYASSIFQYQQGETPDLVDPTTLIPTGKRKGALLPRAKVKNFSKLMGDDLGRFMLGVRHYPGERATALAIMLTAYTAARTGEVIGARWNEFEDLKRPGEALWRIPAARMKAGREHLIGLSTQAQAVLAELREISKCEFLFPAEPGRRADHLSNNAMLFGAYRMGFKGKTTIHGLRGSFSTIAREKSGFDSHVIEVALAHAPGSKTERAYNSAEYLPQRRALLQWWADYLDRIRDEARFGVELVA